MLQLFSYLFDIRRGEWPRLLVLYIMGLIFLTGITWGETIAEAAFLELVGVGVLPYTFIADAVIAIIAVAAYTLFVDRISHAQLLIGIMLISAVLVVVGRGMVGSPVGILTYPFLYLASHVIKDTFVLHWWTYVNSFYDTQAAKRVVPFIATGARVAGIIAGFSMTLLNRWMPPENIVLLWAASLLMVAAGAVLMPRLVKDERELSASGQTGAFPKPRTEAKRPVNRGWRGYTENIREGWSYVIHSPYLRWMAISSLILMTLLPLITYQTSQILKTQLQSTAAISSYVGNLTGITNLIMFPVQLFLMGRIIAWLGLGNTNMIYPTGTLITVGSLAGVPTALFSAGLAYFYRTTFRTSFRMTIDNLLYNAVPLKVKGRARAFTTGLLVPVGSLLGGGLLLLIPVVPNAPWLLPGLLVLLGMAYFIASIFVRRQYSKALVRMLEQEDYSFVLQPAEDLTVVSGETLERLKKQAEESTSPETTVFIAKLMSDVGGRAAVPILVQMARAGSAQTRAAIANILVAGDYRSAEVRGLFTEMLSDPDGAVRLAAVSGLPRWSEQENTYNLALELLRDPEPDIRLQVIPILIRTGDIYYMAAAMQALTPLLTDPSPTRRASAVRLMAQFNDPRFIQSLIPYVGDNDDEVRLEAATAIESLSGKPLSKSVQELLTQLTSTLLHDPVERIRRAALNIMGNLHTPGVQPTLISFLTDPSPEIRETAVQALGRSGDMATLIALSRAEATDPQLRKMLTVVLTKIDKEKSAELIRGYVRANLVQIYGNIVRLEALTPCVGFRGVAVLRDVLRERNESLLEEIFYLLSALHPPSEVRLIAESLNSDSQRVRANAQEALETFLNPQLARMFQPLFNRAASPAQFLEISEELSGVTAQDAGAVLRTLGSDNEDSWARAVVAYALGEIGAATYPPAVDVPEETSPTPLQSSASTEATKPEPPPDPKTRRARRAPSDLLGVLDKPSTEKPSEKPSQKPAEKSLEKPAEDKEPVWAVSPAPAVQPFTPAKDSPCLTLFTKGQLEAMIGPALKDRAAEVRLAAKAARRMMAGALRVTESEDGSVLSTIEKIIFLREVHFFEGMTVDQLKVLASVCEEELFANDAVIFNEGDPGGVMYVVVRGRVALERAGQRKGSTARIGTVEALSYFGEMTMFDDSPRTEKAIAIQDTLTLQLRREPLLALIRQYPDLSLKLINVLSRRLRESSDRIAQLSQVRPRELHKVFDKLE